MAARAWQRMLSGRRLDLLDPTPMDIEVEDIAHGRFRPSAVKLRPGATIIIVLAAGGYPGEYQKGKTIYGLNSITDSLVFHAGTLPDGPSVVSNGGRVLAVTSYGKNLESALERSYDTISKISFEDAYYRKDIGKDVLGK